MQGPDVRGDEEELEGEDPDDEQGGSGGDGAFQFVDETHAPQAPGEAVSPQAGRGRTADGSGAAPVADSDPTGARPARDGPGSRRPARDGSGTRRPVRDGFVSRRPVRDGSGIRRPARDGPRLPADPNARRLNRR
ncbi:hypothetical protein GCM10010363_30890 [Streptomyces omiyaensis]|nr:hypothetical protein GCM10010363_30890 [Streptomyces omiyaensis]